MWRTEGANVVFQPMQGVKVVEVAQFTFTPSSGAVLADWGADVIKVEHAVTGDAQRGLTIGTGGAAAGSFQPLMDHPNRGKRSIGLDLAVPAGHAVLMELVQGADVFVTNFLTSARQRLHLEVEDVRAVNPKVIYVRGSGHGQRGPDAEKPGYDGSTFWSYDDAQLVQQKGGYVRSRGLGGLMLWSLDGDDGTLVAAMQTGLQ